MVKNTLEGAFYLTWSASKMDTFFAGRNKKCLTTHFSSCTDEENKNLEIIWPKIKTVEPQLCGENAENWHWKKRLFTSSVPLLHTETPHLNHHIQLRYYLSAHNVTVAWFFGCSRSDPQLGMAADVSQRQSFRQWDDNEIERGG